MQKLIDTAKIGALTRAAAIHEAEHLIGNYSRTREHDALNWLQKRTNQPSAFGATSGDAITVGNATEIVPGAICEDQG